MTTDKDRLAEANKIALDAIKSGAEQKAEKAAFQKKLQGADGEGLTI